jgi:hypothetical protein
MSASQQELQKEFKPSLLLLLLVSNLSFSFSSRLRLVAPFLSSRLAKRLLSAIPSPLVPPLLELELLELLLELELPVGGIPLLPLSDILSLRANRRDDMIVI